MEYSIGIPSCTSNPPITRRLCTAHLQAAQLWNQADDSKQITAQGSTQGTVRLVGHGTIFMVLVEQMLIDYVNNMQMHKRDIHNTTTGKLSI